MNESADDELNLIAKPGLLKTKDAAKYLQISPGTLKTWRWSGDGPRYIRIGTKSIRYRLQDLEDFIKQK